MKYFTMEELTRSETAAREKIKNDPNAEARANLVALVGAVLDPLREMIGRAIKVTSGYRSALLNRKVGGVSGSQHVRGEAADITLGSRGANAEMGRKIVALGCYDQVIFENADRDGLACDWIHVSWKRCGANRYSILKKVRGVAGYRPVSRKEVGE